MDRLSHSSIHGRFQPFHTGHLEYFKWAKARSSCVFVGITQIYNQHGGNFPGAQHRGRLDSNPLTYFERFWIIERCLLANGFSLSDFRIIPFPIEDPYRIGTFLPIGVKCFTTRHTEWNEHKVKLLTEAGYDVEILEGDESHIPRASGTRIRELFKSGDQDWRNFVPHGTHDLVEELLGQKNEFLSGG